MTTQNPLDTSIFDIFTRAGVSPSAGANFTQAMNINSRSQIINVQFLLTTDANAADREIIITGDDGTDEIYSTGPSSIQTASLAVRYHANIGAPAGTFGTALLQTVPLNSQFILSEGDTLQINVTNIQAGDAITDISIRIKQWITAV